MSMWFQLKSKSSAANQVSRDIHGSELIEKESLVKAHLKMYRVADSAQTPKCCIRLKSSASCTPLAANHLTNGILAPALIFFERRRAARLSERGEVVAKYKPKGPEKAHRIPGNHLLGFYAAFAKFQKIDGLSYWRDSDLRIINIESAHWADAYQCRKRRPAQIPVSVLERRVSYHG